MILRCEWCGYRLRCSGCGADPDMCDTILSACDRSDVSYGDRRVTLARCERNEKKEQNTMAAKKTARKPAAKAKKITKTTKASVARSAAKKPARKTARKPAKRSPRAKAPTSLQ